MHFCYWLVCMQSKMLSSCHRHLCIILHLRSALKSPVECSERYEWKHLPAIVDVYSLEWALTYPFKALFIITFIMCSSEITQTFNERCLCFLIFWPFDHPFSNTVSLIYFWFASCNAMMLLKFTLIACCKSWSWSLYYYIMIIFLIYVFFFWWIE